MFAINPDDLSLIPHRWRKSSLPTVFSSLPAGCGTHMQMQAHMHKYMHTHTHTQIQEFLSRLLYLFFTYSLLWVDRVLECATWGSGLESDQDIARLIFYFNPKLGHCSTMAWSGAFLTMHMPHVYHKQELTRTKMALVVLTVTHCIPLT